MRNYEKGTQTTESFGVQTKAAKRWLWALLIITFLKGWLWAAVFPPFQPSDELHHLGYARDIAQSYTLFVEPRDIFTPEEVVANEIAQLTNVSGYRQPLDLSLTQIQKIEQARKLLETQSDLPSAAPSPWVKFFSRHHPPLFYGIGASLAWLFKPGDMIEHLALGRLLSVFFTVATVGFTFLLAQELFPYNPNLWVVSAVIVSFAPMVTYLGAVFTNQSLEITLFTLFFWFMARVLRQGLSWSFAIVMGTVLSIGLLTKVSFLICLPLLSAVALYDLVKRNGRWQRWLIVAAIPVILAGPWYLSYLGLSSGGLIDSRPEAEGCPIFPVYLSQLPLGSLWFRFWRESAASFGHRDSLWPQTFYQVTWIGFGLALVGWARAVYGAWKKEQKYQFSQNQWIMGAIFLAAWLGAMAFYIILGYIISCDRRAEYTQGRLLIPVMGGFLLFLLMGWLNLTRKYQRYLLAGLIILFVGSNCYSLIQSVTWRYYGSQKIYEVEERNTRSVPLTTKQSVSQCLKIGDVSLNRLDVWLAKGKSTVPGELFADLTEREGKSILQASTENLGWNLDYPSFFSFKPIPIEDEVCITLSGNFGQTVRVWADNTDEAGQWLDGSTLRTGNLAITLYFSVPWQQIPERMAIQSANFYTAEFYWILSIVYFISLTLFVVLYLRYLLSWEHVKRK